MLFDDMLQERFVVVNEDDQFYTGKLDLTWSNNYGMARRYPMNAYGRSRAERSAKLMKAKNCRCRVAIAKPDGTLVSCDD